MTLRAGCFIRAISLVPALLMAGFLRAQAPGATLSGTVTDLSGAAVSNAKVSLRNSATGQAAEATTDAHGAYRVPDLAAGDYEVSIAAEGFTTKVVSVTVIARASQQLDAALIAEPGSEEPSLQDLGFAKAQLQGNAQEQALLEKRSHMLQVHQRLGLITTIPMVLSIVTSTSAKGHHGLPGGATGRDVHAVLGAATTGLYFSSAYFAIRAPKIPGTHVHGPIRVHKALAWIHGPGMVLTPILGAIAYSQLSNGERVHGIAKLHSDAAVVTAAAYGASIIAVSIKF